MGRKYVDNDLIDSISVACTIICTKCDKEDEIFDDESSAIETFFREGWRATPRNTFCPNCAKKYLKPQ